MVPSGLEKDMTENERYQLSCDAAQRYERDFVPTIMKPHTGELFAHVALREGERVLDVACGTGIVTRLAVEQFNNIASIVGVDLNPAMLGIARTHTPATSTPLEWLQSDVCELPFADGSFDVVVCQQGLQYIPNKSAAFHEMQRVLVSGGRLAFTVWSEAHRHNAALADALRRHVSSEAAASCLAPFAWGETEPIRRSVEDAAFGAIEMKVIESRTRKSSSADSVRSFIKTVASRLPVAREIKDCLDVLTQEVSSALQIYRLGDEFVMPSKSHLVQARAA